MDTKKERTADEGAYWRSAFGVWAFRRFVERCLACEADGGGDAGGDWRPEGTE